jgi:hypothetical protein
MGGSDDGDGNGAKGYGVTGTIDGPGSVSTLMLVVVRSTEEEGGGELLLPEEDTLVGLDVEVREEDKDCGVRVDGDWDKGVCGGDDGDVLGSVNGKEDGGAAEARTAAVRRTRMTEALMDE